jgi:two-component system chemotaxis sensor kinase CheA
MSVKKNTRKTREGSSRKPKDQSVAGTQPGGAQIEVSASALNEMAVRLILADSGNNDELESIRGTLAAMSTCDDTPARIRQQLAAASRHLDDIGKAGGGDTESCRSAAGAALQEAAEALEEAAAPTAVAGESPGQTTAAIDDDGFPAAATEPLEATGTQDTDAPSVPHKTSLPADADLDLIAEFVTEGRECIDAAEASLLELETNPTDMEAVNTVFRAFHTIKGTSAFMSLTAVTELAHHAESLLGRVRDHEIQFTGGYADLALRAIDMLKALLTVLQDALGGQPMTTPAGYAELFEDLANPEDAGISSELVDEPIPTPRVGDILVLQGKATRSEVEAVAADQGEAPIGVAIVKSNVASVTDVAKALRVQKQATRRDQAVDTSVRVRTDRLDMLINMVGELVIAQSMVAQDETVIAAEHHNLMKKVGHAGKIVRELQELSMSMRMIPFKGAFQKMARLARDVAHKNGKKVEFVTEGEDTEIDRNMVDVINDPLVHMVRNAIDHGIEPPDQRAESGKRPEGLVQLSACHSGSNIVVTLTDDGRGLNRDRIVAKAISVGLIEADKGMPDNEVFNLIFQPGFSTVEKVTEVSGRGVGMDVVKRGIDALRGNVDIASHPGQGSTFTMRLPLTMAITDGMLVKVGRQRYIIPTISIHLSFRPEPDTLFTVVGRGELVRLRDELMPIFRLHRLFHVPDAIEDPRNGILVVIGDGAHRCALLADEVLGQHQVVAKSLGEHLGKVRGISGGAILGDGRVGLIIDTPELTALAQETSVHYRQPVECHAVA